MICLRGSGERTRLACWLRRLAATNLRKKLTRFRSVSFGRPRFEKFPLARRQRQHARARALPGKLATRYLIRYYVAPDNF
ncbi:MAG: hypothetical protein DME27_02325 [Verrucomicrobia bacterium]|nr:MAG: hypothetical protein DME27_02325 [Verrucomicrobiota bacterium]